MKFDTQVIFKKSVEKLNFDRRLVRKTGILHEGLLTFMIISRSTLLRMRRFRHKNWRKSKQILYVICSFWVIPRHLSYKCRRFGTHCRFHLHRKVNEK